MSYNIRTATSDELRALWDSNSYTEKYFINGINKGNIEFWTIENTEDNQLIAELYIFWDSTDKDEANGVNRAYLCAFRVSKDYQGQKLGSTLMNRVLLRIKDKGYNEVTIGVDPDNEEKLTKMYQHFGFTEFIKHQHVDNHYLGKDNKPTYFEVPSAMYLNRL